MLIRLKHGYAVEIQASGWKVLSPAHNFVGLYETFTEAIHGAALRPEPRRAEYDESHGA